MDDSVAGEAGVILVSGGGGGGAITAGDLLDRAENQRAHDLGAGRLDLAAVDDEFVAVGDGGSVDGEDAAGDRGVSGVGIRAGEGEFGGCVASGHGQSAAAGDHRAPGFRIACIFCDGEGISPEVDGARHSIEAAGDSRMVRQCDVAAHENVAVDELHRTQATGVMNSESLRIAGAGGSELNSRAGVNDGAIAGAARAEGTGV